MFTLKDVVGGGVTITSPFVEEGRGGGGLSGVNSIPDNLRCNSSNSRKALLIPCGVVAPSTFATNSCTFCCISFISDGKTLVLFVALLPTFGGVGGVIAEIGGVRSVSFASFVNSDRGEEEEGPFE